MLKIANAPGLDKLTNTSHPETFLQVSEYECIFKGKLKEYSYLEKIHVGIK